MLRPIQSCNRQFQDTKACETALTFDEKLISDAAKNDRH